MFLGRAYSAWSEQMRADGAPRPFRAEATPGSDHAEERGGRMEIGAGAAQVLPGFLRNFPGEERFEDAGMVTVGGTWIGGEEESEEQ